MDPLCHTLLTRRFSGKQRRLLASDLAPAAPFYPAYVVAQG